MPASASTRAIWRKLQPRIPGLEAPERAGPGERGPIRLGVLASGRGTNLQAVIDARAEGRLAAEVAVVISNNSDALALRRAAEHGIPAVHLSSRTHQDPVELDRAMAGALSEHGCDWILLAGYMKVVGPLTLRRFEGRILNIHPALLPEFGGPGMYGSKVHEAVIAAGRKVTGVTIHLVDEEYDHGPIIARREVPVLDDDTPATLAQRVLEHEHDFLIDTLQAIASGKIRPG